MIASTDFDGGDGCSVDIGETENEITVTIEEDPGGTDGYFCWRIEDGVGETVDIIIDNMSGSAFYGDDTLTVWDDPQNWKDWGRTESAWGSIEWTIESDPTYFTAGPPYPYGATVDRVNQLATGWSDYVETEVIGQSQEGRDLHVVRITDPDPPRSEKTDMFITTRHHPGEVESSYTMDGMIDWLLSELDGGERTLNSVYHLFPNACPDGMYTVGNAMMHQETT